MRLIVPESLADITLSQYQRYQAEIKNTEHRADQAEHLNIKLIEIFCNVSESEVYNIQLGEVYKIAEKIASILESQNELVERFTVDKIKFGWVTNLDELSYGEFLDLNNNISDWETMHISMAVLYREIKHESGKLYNLHKYKGDKYHKEIKEMPMSAVIGSMVFFWNLGLDCVSCITKSLETQTEFQSQLNLVDNGIGIKHSMNLLDQTLQSFRL